MGLELAGGKAMTPGTIFEPRPPKRNWGCIVAAILFLMFVLVVLFFPMGGGGKESEKRTQDLYNLKQIGTAVEIYLLDSDERFPPDMSSPRAALKYLAPFLKQNEGQYGALRSLVTGSPEYLGNGSLALKNRPLMEKPENVLGFFDSAPFPNNRRNVMSADTAARSLHESQFQRAVANGWRWQPMEPTK